MEDPEAKVDPPMTAPLGVNQVIEGAVEPVKLTEQESEAGCVSDTSVEG